MSDRWKHFVPIVLLIAAFVWRCQWENSPERKAREKVREAASRKQDAADRMQELLDAWNVVRHDEASVVRRVIFATRGTRVEVDAGEGRVYGKTFIRSFVERGSEYGFQRGDRSVSTMSITNSNKGTQSTWLRLGNGFNPSLHIDSRASFEVVSHALDAQTKQVVDGTRVYETFGSGMDLRVRDGRWRLLWKRQSGELLEWRRRDEILELRWSGIRRGDGAPAFLTAKGRRPFLDREGDWYATVTGRALSRLRRRVSCVLTRHSTSQSARRPTWTVELLAR